MRFHQPSSILQHKEAEVQLQDFLFNSSSLSGESTNFIHPCSRHQSKVYAEPKEEEKIP